MVHGASSLEAAVFDYGVFGNTSLYITLDWDGKYAIPPSYALDGGMWLYT
uniref:Uncharacterized protein n=1 Tax=Anguilla anguilla TaxID=7936 RepID=A0A0E9UVS2_ANGAN